MTKKNQSEKSDKKNSLEKYGTFFAKDLLAMEVVEKCDVLIEKYKGWIENLEALKVDKSKEAEESQERFDDILKRMKSLSDKEKKLFLKKMRPQMRGSNK
ncbi:hypothetical protein PO183_01615 [Bacteroides ovatus]|jgi:hypothetical protein|uniref:hypothetical protein n=1 Tax=Bacteroides ovatus TaxID=28116 RepID=UPI00233F47DB|nr:hypothetical protein [Bacteroides ovatus]MDC2364847.1 hypothetical protein [Bacteroides ovatus]